LLAVIATSPACSSDPAVSIVDGTVSGSVRLLAVPKEALLLEVWSTKGLGKPEKNEKPEPKPRPQPKPVLAVKPALGAAVLLLEAVVAAVAAAVAVLEGRGTLGRRPGGRLSTAGGGGELGLLLLLLLGGPGGGLLGLEGGGFGVDDGAGGCCSEPLDCGEAGGACC
jgi:hypothetical protein